MELEKLKKVIEILKEKVGFKYDQKRNRFELIHTGYPEYFRANNDFETELLLNILIGDEL